jgi:tetratricopeptide (TPR) repeat protein
MLIKPVIKLTYILCLLITFGFSQTASNEEKFSYLKSLGNDSLKCASLYDLGFSLRAEDPLIAYACGSYLKEISAQLSDTFYLARAYNLLGILHYRNQEFDKALSYHKEALKWRELLKNESEIAASYTNLGNVYSDLEEFEVSGNYHLKAFSFFQKTKNKKQVLNCLSNLGILKEEQGNYQESRNNLEQALLLAEQLNDMEARVMCSNNLGYLYQIQQQYDQALSYYFDCVKMNEQMDLQSGLAMSYYNVASIYKLKSDLKEAKRWFQQALLLADSSGAIQIKKITLNELSSVSYLLGNYQLAYDLLKQKDTIADLQFENTTSTKINFPDAENFKNGESKKIFSTTTMLLTLALVLLIIVSLWYIKSSLRHEQKQEK